MLLPRIRTSRTPPRPPEISLLAIVLNLLTLLSAASAQNISIDSLPSLASYNLTAATSPLVLVLPPFTSSPQSIFLTLSLCVDLDTLPIIFLTNSTTIEVPTLSDLSAKKAKGTVWSFALDAGFASWNGSVGEGGLRVAVSSEVDTEVEISIAQDGPFLLPLAASSLSSHLAHRLSPSLTAVPLQTVSSTLPVLADTTSRYALLFTPVFASPPDALAPQTYPNYILPPPRVNATPPSSPPNHTLYIFPTTDSSVNTLGKSSCYVRKRTDALKNVTVAGNETRLLAGKGWREMLLLEGKELTSEGNFTVWMERKTGGSEAVELSGPISFRMKEGQSSFSPPFVASFRV